MQQAVADVPNKRRARQISVVGTWKARGARPHEVGESHGVIFITGSMGRVREYNSDKICEVLGEPVLAVYDQRNKLPKRLPNAAYIVILVSAAGHDAQEMVQKRKHPESRVIHLSHKWSVAEGQLRAAGFVGVLPVVEEQALVGATTDGSLSGGGMPRVRTTTFIKRLMERFPTLSLVDLVILRHSGLLNPVRASKSVAALLIACQEVKRELELSGPFTQATVSPVAPSDKFFTVVKEILRPDERVEPHSDVRSRIDFIDGIIGGLQRVPSGGKVWGEVQRALAKVSGPVAGWNPRFDTLEFRLLCHARGLRGGGTVQEVVEAALAVLAGREREAAPAVEITSSSAPALEERFLTGAPERFYRSLFVTLPGMSIADCAWLRQQSEVWPARVCGWEDVARFFAEAGHAVAPETTDQRLRAASDDALLSVAYELVPATIPPERESVQRAREFRILGVVAEHVKVRKAGVADVGPLFIVVKAAAEALGWELHSVTGAELWYLLGAPRPGMELLYAQRGWASDVADLLRAMWVEEHAEAAPRVEVAKVEVAKVEVVKVEVPRLEEVVPVSQPVVVSSQPTVAVPATKGLGGEVQESDGRDLRAALRRAFPAISHLMEVYGVKTLTFGPGGKVGWVREKIIVQQEVGEDSLVDD